MTGCPRPTSLLRRVRGWSVAHVGGETVMLALGATNGLITGLFAAALIEVIGTAASGEVASPLEVVLAPAVGVIVWMTPLPLDSGAR